MTLNNQENKMDKLSASEALFAFVGWLTTRNEVTIMSAFDNASLPAELVWKFCKAYGLEEPSPDFHNKIISIENDHEPVAMSRIAKLFRDAINIESAENDSDTPDYILALCLEQCLQNFNRTVRRRANSRGEPIPPAWLKEVTKL